MSMKTPGSHDAARILQLVNDDPAVAAALDEAYRGRHTVTDALWWRAHPLSQAPSGASDPSAEHSRLQSEAYSRSGAASAEAEVVDPLTDEPVVMPARAAPLFLLERQLEADAEALDLAIQDARPELDRAEARAAERVAARARAERAERAAQAERDRAVHLNGSRGRNRRGDRRFGHELDAEFAAADAANGAGADEADGAGGAEEAADPARRRTAASWRKRSQIWMWTAIACGVVLLGGVGLVVVQQVAPEATPGFALLPGASGTGIPTPTPTDGVEGVTLGLTIFDDPSLAPSIPPANIDPYYKPDSLRLLGVADSDLTVYAVENRVDQPCLLAVYTDGTQSATCVTTDEFQSMGIELRITSLRVPNASDTYPYRLQAQDVVFWNPDGSYGVSSTPQKSPTAGPGG
ncbi:MAG: hypothetical protein JWQ64_1550 [Subtercola sp.]|nr:hypothetical protein [Subtercola sp.]